LDLFEIDRIPFPSFKFQVSSFEYHSLKENDCPEGPLLPRKVLDEA